MQKYGKLQNGLSAVSRREMTNKSKYFLILLVAVFSVLTYFHAVSREMVFSQQERFKKEGIFYNVQMSHKQDTKHPYHLYTLLLDLEHLAITRDVFLDEMTKRNIGVGVHYIALHPHLYYQRAFGYKQGDFANAEWISERTVSLPISPKLTDNDVKDVIEAVQAIFKDCG